VLSPEKKRHPVGVYVLGAALLVAAVAIAMALWQPPRPLADPDNPQQVERGKAVYDQYCAACHGPQLEGQPDWRERRPDGRLPAPPHDDTGHTWHHSDRLLFELTKYGVGRYAPPGYESDMPAFAGILSDDDLWAVLAYIKSSWSPQVRAVQRKIDKEGRRR
jgi:mono/diheme cytochrome c family protein